MTDDERRELVKKYRMERVRAMNAFNRERFDGKTLSKLFQIKNRIVEEFEAMYGEPENDAAGG